MQFTFPQEALSQVDGKNSLKEWLCSQLKRLNLYSYCTYRIKEVKNIYIYCICYHCSARIVFRKGDAAYNLVKVLNKHVHRKKHFRKKNIIEDINNYPDCFNTKSIKREIITRYGISQTTFYRYFKQAKFPSNNIQQTLINLENEGIFGVKIYQDNEQIPSLLLLTSEKMIESFQECQKIVRFDLTYNLIRQRVDINNQYAVGTFVGLCNNLQIRPLCLVIVERETKQTFIRLFQEFFMLMRSHPRIIITDQQKAIKYALQELKSQGIYEGYHFLDLFHVQRNIKNELFIKSSMSYITSLASSENIYEYNRRYKICQDNLIARDLEVLARHENKFSLCCLSQIPNLFIGLSCSSNPCQKINDIIKQKIPFSQRYSQVVYTVCRIFQKMPISQEAKIQKLKIENLITVNEIKKIRSSVTKAVFSIIMKQLTLSLHCLISYSDNSNQYQVTEQQFEQQEPFVVDFVRPTGKWVCSCSYSQKVGIPCCHIIKVLLFKKENIMSALNPWWILSLKEENKKSSSQILLLPPRKTRRSN